MSGYYQPPPPPPQYGGGSAPPPTPPRQNSGLPSQTYSANAQYSYGNVSPQQQTQYGYQTAPPSASPASYYPPPPGPPPPGHSGYSYAPTSTAPGSVTTAPPQNPPQSYPPPQSPSYSYPPQSSAQSSYPPPQSSPPSYPPPPQSQSHSYHPPPPLPARSQPQQSLPSYPPHAPYNPAQNGQTMASQSHHPPPPAPYYNSPAAPHAPATHASASASAASIVTVNRPPQQQAAYTASSPPPLPPMSTRPPVQNTSNSYAPPPPSTLTAAGQPLPAVPNYPPAPPALQSNQHQYPRRPIAGPSSQQTAAPTANPATAYQATPQTYQTQSGQIPPIQPINDATSVPSSPAVVQQRIPASTSTPSQDSMANLYTQMDNLNMNSTGHYTTPQPPLRALNDDAPRPPAHIRATGPPLEVITYCPETRAVDYSLYWYRLPDIPDFMICTRCHADHIQSTQLASKFEKIKRPDNFYSMCCFWFPRVKEVMWPQAVRSGNMDALRVFMKKRLNVKTCKGRNPTPASDGIKWYGMTGTEINGFISCEACYEDRIAGTPFETRFSPYREQPANEKWSCDVAVPYISRAIVKTAKMNDWAGFVALATRRLSLPACEGKEIQSNACTWYLPRRKIENMRACEACYLDRVGYTRFEREFEKYSMTSGLDSFISHFTQLWSCKLNEANLPLVWAMENAIEQRNWSVFSSSAEVACRLPPCTANGIIRGNWWTVQGGCDNFDVCETCYVSILRTSGIAQFFEPAQRSREATLVCDFCIASPRFRQYLRKYAQSVDQGVFSYYLDYVRTFASIPVCPGLEVVEKGHWWGYPNALFCEDCYLSFVADTKPGNFVAIKRGYDERAQICQIWSSRMRTMWLQVCDAGAPGSPESNAKLAEFTEFGSKRLKIYTQTIPQMTFIRKMKEMKMKNAMHQGLLSVMYNGMDGLSSISGAVDGNLHGNSQLGWYATEQGAQGAQMFNNMQAGFANANRMDEWMQMFQLEMIWKEVE
ncbi:hypothetical protein V8C35DRAFT_264473 [Trichoderma chlorosporum]